MISYINSIEISSLYHTLARIYKLNIIDAISNHEVTIVKVDTWNQLIEDSETDDLFSNNSKKFYVYDIHNLTLNKVILQQLQADNNIILYSSCNKLLKDDKKLLLECGIEIKDLVEISQADVKTFVLEYSARLKLKLDSHDVEKITKLSQNYFEIIDTIDFISLAENKNSALKSLEQIQAVPIFMLPLRYDSIHVDITKWLPYLKADDSQLILSMMFTKLSKHTTESTKDLLKQLIVIDNISKTQSKINSIQLLKLFIWKIRSRQTYAI